jgi:hypothetical protein
VAKKTATKKTPAKKAAPSETPPAERVASGSPLEGGVHIGKAPLGLWLIYSKSSSNCC